MDMEVHVVFTEGGSQWHNSKRAWNAAESHAKDMHWELNWQRWFSLPFFPSPSVISINTKPCMFISLLVRT